MKIKALTIAALGVIFFGLMGIYSEIKMRNEYLKGEEVFVKVIEKPYNCASIRTRTSFIKVQYADRTYGKKIGMGYCDELEKDSILVKISPDKRTIFFLDDIKSFPGEIAASVLIILVGIVIFVKSKKSSV